MGDPALSKLFEQQADQLQTLQGESRNFQPKMKKQMVQVAPWCLVHGAWCSQACS